MAKKEVKKVVKKTVKTDPKSYKKDEFVSLVSQKADITKKDANNLTDAFLESLSEILSNGDSVNFIGFGSFSITHREARDGRNPSTGEAMKIKASNVVKFKVGSTLKGKVNVQN